jgi:hypothetical protein
VRVLYHGSVLRWKTAKGKGLKAPWQQVELSFQCRILPPKGVNDNGNQTGSHYLDTKQMQSHWERARHERHDSNST